MAAFIHSTVVRRSGVPETEHSAVRWVGAVPGDRRQTELGIAASCQGEEARLLVSTAEAIMERLPLPESLSRLSVGLKVGAKYAEQDLRTRLEALGYDLDEEAEYPGAALFHGKTFEIFPAGALNPFRIEHSGKAIRKIVAVDPEEHEVMFEVKELLVDPMSERLALGGKRGERATLSDYCGRARWIADAGIPATPMAG